MSKIQFNKQQQEAIDFKDGACGVIASAGSGKTTLLLERIRKLVHEHNVFERDILTISFTRNTADDLIKRLAKMGLHHVNVGTFHSICIQQLNKEGYNINGSKMVQEWQIDNCFKAIDQKVDVKDVSSFISYQKNYMVKPDDEFIKKDSAYTEDELRKFYKAYEKMKDNQGLYDFDDYLLLCLEMLRENPGKYTYDYILVDEHQDSNKVQNMLLKEWCQSGNIFTVYDFRQAIYGFRGGTTEYSMNFERYWEDAQVKNVYINYRSPKNIVEKSNQFIRQYYKDYEHYVDSESYSDEDGYIEISSPLSQEVEAIEVVDKIEKLISEGVALKEIAVLYRNNKHADFVENQLKLRGVDYDIANDSSFFKRREIAGILSFLRLIMNTDDNSAFEGVFKLRVYPLMYFSNKILADIQDYANKNDVSLYNAMQYIDYPQSWHKSNVFKFYDNIERIQQMIAEDDKNVISVINEIVKLFQIKKMINDKYSNKEERDERLNSIEVLKSFVKGNNLEQFITYVYSNTERKKKKENAVQLMTIHRSKGLEWDNVFLIGVQDGEFPSQREGAMNTILEEARLFYVAVTRSKKNLWVSEIGKGNQFVKEYGYDGVVCSDKYQKSYEPLDSYDWLNVDDEHYYKKGLTL